MIAPSSGCSSASRASASIRWNPTGSSQRAATSCQLLGGRSQELDRLERIAIDLDRRRLVDDVEERGCFVEGLPGDFGRRR